MKTELSCADIAEDLCKMCAHCCLSIRVPIPVDDRSFEFYEAVGLNIKRDEVNLEIGLLDVGACQHLIKSGKGFACGIYEERPKLCKQYNCVGWGLYADVESEDMKYALDVYNKLDPV